MAIIYNWSAGTVAQGYETEVNTCVLIKPDIGHVTHAMHHIARALPAAMHHIARALPAAMLNIVMD